MQLTEEKPEEVATDHYSHLRVTPQEFAEALVTAEQKRSGTQGTVPLGEAIHALDTEIPAEEIYAIITAKRARLANTVETISEQKARRNRRLFPVVAAIAAGSIFLNLGLLLPRLRPIALPPGAISVAEMSEATPVSVSLDALEQLNRGASQNEVPVYRDANDSKNIEVALTNKWTLIKIRGELFVKGCFDTNAASQGKANFLNDTLRVNSGTQATIPISAFKGVLDLSFRDPQRWDVVGVHLQGYPTYAQPKAATPQ